MKEKKKPSQNREPSGGRPILSPLRCVSMLKHVKEILFPTAYHRGADRGRENGDANGGSNG